jgi:hypothetical protein
MANVLYELAARDILEGTLVLDEVDLKILLVDQAGYAINVAADQYLSDIPIDARGGTSSILSGVAISGNSVGIPTAEFSATTGSYVDMLVLFVDTGTEGTSRLVAAFDTADNLPFQTFNGTIRLSFGGSILLTLE